jgi:hypothetical protein
VTEADDLLRMSRVRRPGVCSYRRRTVHGRSASVASCWAGTMTAMARRHAIIRVLDRDRLRASSPRGSPRTSISRSTCAPAKLLFGNLLRRVDRMARGVPVGASPRDGTGGAR